MERHASSQPNTGFYLGPGVERSIDFFFNESSHQYSLKTITEGEGWIYAMLSDVLYAANNGIFSILLFSTLLLLSLIFFRNSSTVSYWPVSY